MEESNRARPLMTRINEEIKSGFSQEEIEPFKRMLGSLLEKFGKSRRKRTRRKKGKPRRTDIPGQG
jgi:hypothetical protein